MFEGEVQRKTNTAVPSRLTSKSRRTSKKVFLLLYSRLRPAVVMFVTQLATAACDKDLEHHLYRIRVPHVKAGRWAEEWEMHGRGQQPTCCAQIKGPGGQGAHPA